MRLNKEEFASAKQDFEYMCDDFKKWLDEHGSNARIILDTTGALINLEGEIMTVDDFLLLE